MEQNALYKKNLLTIYMVHNAMLAGSIQGYIFGAI